MSPISKLLLSVFLFIGGIGWLMILLAILLFIGLILTGGKINIT